MVLTPPIVFAQTDGIESVLLNHTHTRGPSVTRMRDSFFLNFHLKGGFNPSFPNFCDKFMTIFFSGGSL